MATHDRTARPNILWITTHDINPDLGCYAGAWQGAEYAETPNLDGLAADGLRYARCYSVAPVCAPSRCALITGMYPTAIGTMHMRSRAVPPPEVKCFTEYLRAAGYYCTNNSFNDYNFQTPITAWDENGTTAHWRNRPDAEQPFLAAFHGHLTHESQIYSDDEQHLRNTAALRPEQRHDPAAAPVPPYYPDTPVTRQAFARYSDNITAMDVWVGELLAQLASDGLAANTLVVFCSDHGRGMPRGKYVPYETGLRVPLIVRWPGVIDPGTVRTEPVGLIDVAATMLAAAGLAVPDHMHGRPLFDARGQFAHPRPYIFGHSDRMGTAYDTIRTVRDGRFRYTRNFHPDRPYFPHQEYNNDFSMVRQLRHFEAVENFTRQFGGVPDALTDAQRAFLTPNKPPEELYDHDADPHEVANLAGDRSYATELQRLRAALDAWQEACGDLGLIDEDALIERWRPGGVAPITEPPRLEIVDGRVAATCRTPGASIAWTPDPPAAAHASTMTISEAAAVFVRAIVSRSGEPVTPQQTREMNAVIGDAPRTDGRFWHLYCEPFVPPAGPIWFRACRIGYTDSPDTRFEAGTAG